MLRSLVGSEMCIRDRYMHCYRFAITYSVSICTFLALFVCSGRRRYARCTHCLLYTSDAADDLLCVDLGGRRIIKKKKEIKKIKKHKPNNNTNKRSVRHASVAAR